MRKKIGEDKVTTSTDITREATSIKNTNDVKFLMPEQVKDRDCFIKIDGSDEIHGFGSKVVVSKSDSIFKTDLKDKTIIMPLDVLTFVGLEYKFETLKDKLVKNYKCVEDVVNEGDLLFAKVNVIKPYRNLGLSALNSVRRSLDEYLDVENIPEEIRHIASTIEDPIRLRDGETYIILESSAVLTEIFLVDLVHIPTIDIKDVRGSNKKEIKKERTAKIVSEFLSYLTVTDIAIKKESVYFGIVISYSDTFLYLEANTENISVVNASMNQARFQELAEEELGFIRKRTEVKFVRTSELISSSVVRDLVYSRSDIPMVRTPLIELVELNDEEVKEILSTKTIVNGTEVSKSAGKPLFMFKEAPAKGYLAMYGRSKARVIDDRTVKLLFSNLYNAEPVYKKDPAKGKSYLCPDIRQMAMFTLTGETDLPFKVGVTTTPTEIGVAFETAK